MKALFIASLLLFSFCSFGQTVDTTNMIRYDPKIWITNPSRGVITRSQADSVRHSRCQHIYTEVEPENIKQECGNLPYTLVDILPYGKSHDFSMHHNPALKVEGKELVCVKCFRVTKQVTYIKHPNCGLTNWDSLAKATGDRVRQK